MNNFTLRMVFLSLLTLLTCQSAVFAQLDEFGRWKTDLYYVPVHLNYTSYSEGDFANALNRLKEIESDNNKMPSEWAGDYSASTGEVSQSALRWSPSVGFVYLGFYTCTPEVRSLRYGKVIAAPTYLQLKSQNVVNREAAVKYLFVKWGERHYLVPETEVAEFYKYVAGYGWKDDAYIYFDFLLRDGDFEKPITGMPVFPPGYERFIKKPIEASITKILRREVVQEEDFSGKPQYSSKTLVEINAGRRQGIKRGMKLNLIDSEDYESVEIMQAGASTSTAILVRSLDENKKETFKNRRTDEIKEYPALSVGTQLSTRSLVLINNGAI